MSLQDSLKSLQQKIKNFQDVAKDRIYNLSRFKITVIKPNNEKLAMTLSMVLHFLRNKRFQVHDLNQQ